MADLTHSTSVIPEGQNTNTLRFRDIGDATRRLAIAVGTAVALAGAVQAQETKGTQVAVATSPAPAPTPSVKGFGQVLKLKDGTELTWNGLLEIGKVDPKKEAEILGQLPEETRRTQKREYATWKESELVKEVNQLNASIASGEKRLAEKTGVDAGIKEKLITKTTAYIKSVEDGKLPLNPEYIRGEILNNPLFSEKLKARAEKLL